MVICLNCMSLFVALFTRVRNNLCIRTCGPVIQVVPFFFFEVGWEEVGFHNVDFVKCISRSGHVAYLRLIKEQSKYLARNLKISKTWEP